MGVIHSPTFDEGIVWSDEKFQFSRSPRFICYDIWVVIQTGFGDSWQMQTYLWCRALVRYSHMEWSLFRHCPHTLWFTFQTQVEGANLDLLPVAHLAWHQRHRIRNGNSGVQPDVVSRRGMHHQLERVSFLCGQDDDGEVGCTYHSDYSLVPRKSNSPIRSSAEGNLAPFTRIRQELFPISHREEYTKHTVRS